MRHAEYAGKTGRNNLNRAKQEREALLANGKKSVRIVALGRGGYAVEYDEGDE